MGIGKAGVKVESRNSKDDKLETTLKMFTKDSFWTQDVVRHGQTSSNFI